MMARQNVQWAGVVLLSLGILLACSSEDISISGGDAGDVGDAEVGSDVIVDTGSTSTDAGGDGGAVDAEPEEDWGEQEWTDCECAHPEDKCVSHSCGRPGVMCGEGEGCPDGYECVEYYGEHYCRCSGDAEECGPFCEGFNHEDCPGPARGCDWERGLCRQGISCQNSLMCPEGTVCESSESIPPSGGGGAGSGRCYETGDLEVGESCEDYRECASGYCRCPDGYCTVGECVEQCLNDGDCDDGESCLDYMGMIGHSFGGCVETDCNISCPDDRRCRNDTCRTPFCRTSADCVDGDCVHQGVSFLGECETYEGAEDYACKPEEYRSSMGSGEYCLLPDICMDDEDCSEPYECGGSSCRRPIDAEEEE